MKLNDVIDFLGKEEKKGTLKSATAAALRAACSKVQTFLEDNEDNEDDVEWLINNLDDVFRRVANKDESLNQSSIQTYKSRAMKALDLYQKFKADPLNWHKDLQHRVRKHQPTGTKGAHSQINENETMREGHASTDISFPLRDDFIFKAKLPKDIKMQEMKRLFYNMITYAKDFDPMRDKGEWFYTPSGQIEPSHG